MQDAPPDILITNYSMLNIMLMRDIEAPIFDMTRQWLDADPAHVFHLVVDELHTYRGTPGTEVGYILRVLYERLGLHPDHPQLRILASSASLGDDEARAQDYLRQFFGRSRHFELIRGGARCLSCRRRRPAARSGRSACASGTRQRRRITAPASKPPSAPSPRRQVSVPGRHSPARTASRRGPGRGRRPRGGAGRMQRRHG